jgi:hypothetical protein
MQIMPMSASRDIQLPTEITKQKMKLFLVVAVEGRRRVDKWLNTKSIELFIGST